MKRINFCNLQIMSEDFIRINELMKNGIQTEKLTGKKYFTGYSYNTLYDWDQYFEAIVQLYLGWGTKYIKNGVTIFLDHQQDSGFIARSLSNNETAYEQQTTELVKPFLSQISLLVYKRDRDISWITEKYYEKLKKYLTYWLTEKDKNSNGLCTWDSGPHSGMDDQVERVGGWFSCFSEGVDLNTFIYRECIAFSKIAELMGNTDDKNLFVLKANNLKTIIQEKMWCEQDGFFYDIHENTGEFIKVKSSSGFAPLWAGIATNEQAKRIVSEHLLNPQEFWRAFPVPSYAATEPGYREERLETDVGCNWRAQTWIPVNYYLMHGLMNYGFNDVANQLAYKTYEMIKKIGDREYYNTDSCTGNGLNPFWGWSLLAYFMPMENELNFDPTNLEPSIIDLFQIVVNSNNINKIV